MKYLILFIFHFSCVWADYDPSRRHGMVQTQLTKFSYGEDNREVPLKLYLPEKKNAPTIFLSHGLGGNREVGKYLAEHWAARGFMVIAIEHKGSNTEVIRNAPKGKRFIEAKKAASFGNFILRTKDVKASATQVINWSKDGKSVLHGRINKDQLAIGGHSFGAITSQAVTGQNFPIVGKTFTDERLKAAFMMSPSPALKGSNADAFGEVLVPWLLMTGTKDVTRLTKTTAAGRKEVYKHLPKGNKYQVVLYGAEHMAFSDRTILGGQHRNKNHHRVIKSISTAFFEAHLAGNKEAEKWIKSTSPKKIMQFRDTWETK